jgi:hypothetical protein
MFDSALSLMMVASYGLTTDTPSTTMVCTVGEIAKQLNISGLVGIYADLKCLSEEVMPA